MFKFEVGQIVKNDKNKLYMVEDNAVDSKGDPIYLLREIYVEHTYAYEKELENCDARYSVEA